MVRSKSQLRWALKVRKKSLARKNAALKKQQKKAVKVTADEAVTLVALQG